MIWNKKGMMKTQTLIKIEAWLTQILDKVNQSGFGRKYVSQSSAAGDSNTKSSGECAACNNYQYKEKK